MISKTNYKPGIFTCTVIQWLVPGRQLYVLLVMLFLTTISSLAQTDSLDYYKKEALKNNPLVRQKYAEYRANAEKVIQSGIIPDPTLEAGLFLKPMELIGGNQVAEIKIMQMLPWFGVLGNGKDEMTYMAAASFEQYRDACLQITFNVEKTVLDIYKVRKQIKASEESQVLLKTIEDLARTGLSTIQGSSSSASEKEDVLPVTPVSAVNSSGSGMTNMNMTGQGAGQQDNKGGMVSGPGMSGTMTGNRLIELNGIRIEYENLAEKTRSLRDVETLLTAKLNSFLNRPDLTVIHVPSEITPAISQLQIGALIDSLSSNNPMLKMADLEKKAYGSRLKMTRAMGYPMVGFGLSYSLLRKNPMSVSEMNGSDMIMPMVSMTMPIYRKKYKSMTREVSLQEEEAGFGYDNLLNELKIQLMEAVQSYDEACRRFRLSITRSRLTEESLQLSLTTLMGSQSSLSDVLRSRQQLLEYKLEEAQAAADIEIAGALVYRLTGYKIKK
ncbi:MAG: TolC family protein [Bacteroidales bacterium]